MSDRNSSQQLQRETEAARILREQLAELAAGDEDVIRDTIEGATNLHELIAKVVVEVGADEASAKGIDDLIKTMKARKERLEARAESRRAAILNAMSIGEIRKLELAIATLNRQPTAAKVIITNEAEIPSGYWKRADPQLDRRAIGAALKEKKEVPGATLSNGNESLVIRFG